MTKSELEQLIDRYLQGKASKREKQVIDAYYNRLILQDGGKEGWKATDKEQLRERMYRKILKRTRINVRRRIRYIWSAAAAVLILLVSAYLYINSSTGQTGDITTLVVEKTITADSDQRSLLLSDGTYVLLNPGATITYPSEFEEELRQIELTGEAWFDVQRDTSRPFQVLTEEVTTTVLGTSFSINALPGSEMVEVKVTSGRVQVSSAEKELAVLEKDDHLVYKNSGEVEVTRNGVDKEAENLPVPGAFKLANVTMAEAADFIEKRWGKDISFENEAIERCPLYASFNADDTMEEVLMIICGVSNSKYKLKNGKIIIYGKGCDPDR